MIDRLTFLMGALAAASAKPSPTPTPFPWDTCDKSRVLPYDRPLDMRIPVLDGPDFNLMDYRGRCVLLNVFATWCGPCNKEQPDLVKAAIAYAPKGLAVIGINDREEDNTVRAYRKKYGISYPIAMDRRGGFTANLQDDASQTSVEYPVSIFITPRGFLYCYLAGGMSGDEMTYRFDKFLAEAPPTWTPVPSPSPSPSA